MDLFEQLRREHEFGIGTIAGVAAKFGVHRRMVRQAIAGALPPPHAYPQRVKPKLDGVMAFIDAVSCSRCHHAFVPKGGIVRLPSWKLLFRDGELR